MRPSSYQPTYMIDRIGKLFEKILMARILRGMYANYYVTDSSDFDPDRTLARIAESTRTLTRTG
jgi:hypothetical protein